jgi:hypothetical protein
MSHGSSWRRQATTTLALSFLTALASRALLSVASGSIDEMFCIWNPEGQARRKETRTFSEVDRSQAQKSIFMDMEARVGWVWIVDHAPLGKSCAIRSGDAIG